MVVAEARQGEALLDEAFLESQRRELLSRLESYRDQVERLSASAVELSLDRGLRDGGDEEGFGEADPREVERDRALALVTLAQRRTGEIEAALTRLEEGGYGRCEGCHGPIGTERLEALPETTQCVTCKSSSIGRRASH